MLDNQLQFRWIHAKIHNFYLGSQFCNLTYYYLESLQRSGRTMKRNFQLGNVPLSQEGEGWYIRMLDGMRILIYFGVCLPSEGFKLEDSSIWKAVQSSHRWTVMLQVCCWTPLSWHPAGSYRSAEDTTTGPGPLPGGPVNGLHLCSKFENLAAPCCPQEFYLLQWHRNCFRKSCGLPSPYQHIRREELLFFQSTHCISHHQTNRFKAKSLNSSNTVKEKQASFHT